MKHNITTTVTTANNNNTHLVLLVEHQCWVWWWRIPYDIIEWPNPHHHVYVLLRVTSYKRNLVEICTNEMSDDSVFDHECTGMCVRVCVLCVRVRVCVLCVRGSVCVYACQCVHTHNGVGNIPPIHQLCHVPQTYSDCLPVLHCFSVGPVCEFLRDCIRHEG